MSGKSKYITFLRDPVERLISHYHYVLRRPKHYLYEQVVKDGLSLSDYVTSDISPELSNHQVRMISGREDGELGLSDLEQAKDFQTCQI